MPGLGATHPGGREEEQTWVSVLLGSKGGQARVSQSHSLLVNLNPKYGNLSMGREKQGQSSHQLPQLLRAF